MRNRHLRNLVVWIGVVMVAAGLWFAAARPRLHFIDPGAFLILVALAAAVLTALLWWEKRTDETPPPDRGDR